MGWFPTPIDESLRSNLTPAFWKDLQKHLVKTVKEYKKVIGRMGEDAFYELEYEDRPPYLPSGLPEYCLNDISDLKEEAFNYDHMEHIGQWLYDKNLWPVFKKHKISGAYVLSHENGDGGIGGIIFKDGVPYAAKTKITITKGKRLK